MLWVQTRGRLAENQKRSVHEQQTSVAQHRHCSDLLDKDLTAQQRTASTGKEGTGCAADLEGRLARRLGRCAARALQLPLQHNHHRRHHGREPARCKAGVWGFRFMHAVGWLDDSTMAHAVGNVSMQRIRSPRRHQQECRLDLGAIMTCQQPIGQMAGVHSSWDVVHQSRHTRPSRCHHVRCCKKRRLPPRTSVSREYCPLIPTLEMQRPFRRVLCSPAHLSVRMRARPTSLRSGRCARRAASACSATTRRDTSACAAAVPCP